MKNNASNSSSNTLKVVTGIFLFCYFGFIIFPQWSRPWSTQFIVWLSLLAVVTIALAIMGIYGGIGLWREKARKATPNPQNKYFIWVASLSILWFLISIAFARTTYFAYFHPKFDSEKWKSVSWDEAVGPFGFTLRERMLDDLTKNVLPGRTRTEVIQLLGQPDKGHVESKGTPFYYIGWSIMEPKCLFIEFDEQGVTKEYDVTTVCR